MLDMTNSVSFTKVKLPNGWLSNMSPHKITVAGVVYPTAEHLFQLMRLPHDHPIRDEILSKNSPMTAKMIAKSYEIDFIVKPHSIEDVRNMFRVLELKMDSNPELVESLKATGKALIVEDVGNRNDSFWGAKWDGTEWEGLNILGHLWMDHRELVSNE